MFDTVLLKTFMAVVQTRHFTEAGRRLGLSQSTVSQHVRRLEAIAGRRLLARDTHAVSLTSDGEAMVGFAP
jgi:DNA-binding transcriptional LysR family regulator